MSETKNTQSDHSEQQSYEILHVAVFMVNRFIWLFPCGCDMSTENQAGEGAV